MYHYLSPKQLIAFRTRAVRDAQIHGFSQTSRRYGLSRQTLYRWARDPIPKQRGPSTGQLESREQVKLDGVEAWCEVYLGKDGMRTIQYHGVRDGKFFIVGWVYNTTNSQAKSDIENSIASFRWR